MLCFVVVFVVLFGIGVALGLACAACAAVLVALGIVSSSAVVAVCCRRFSSGLLAFHYQLCAAVGLPAGVFVLWLGSLAFNLHLGARPILSRGSASGIAAGLLLAFAFDRLARLAYSVTVGSAPRRRAGRAFASGATARLPFL